MRKVFLTASLALSLNAAELFKKALPSLPGPHTMTAIEVPFKGGESHHAHIHDAHTFVYVLEGEIESQIEGEPVTAYKKGATFYEYPGQKHLVSRNKSATQPAKILVYFLSKEGASLMRPVEK